MLTRLPLAGIPQGADSIVVKGVAPGGNHQKAAALEHLVSSGYLDPQPRSVGEHLDLAGP